MPTTEQHDSTEFAGLDAATANLNTSIASLSDGIDSICGLVDELRSQRADLLAALKAMVASYDGLRDTLTSPVVRQKLANADAAIAKAEGGAAC